MSPFAISAQKHGLDYKGGKPDDVTVLLARVITQKDSKTILKYLLIVNVLGF